MGKEYIPLFLDFNETTQDLSDEECGRLVRAIVAYANDTDYELFLTGAEKIAFRFLKGLVDRNTAISEKRAQAGSKHSKQEQEEANDNKTEQSGTSENKTEQNEAKNAIEIETEIKNKNKNKNKDIQKHFDRFWLSYPRHEAKQTALKAFEKINPDDELLAKMISAIEKQKKTSQWQENNGQYIPHPATWLNQRRWEDEVTTSQPKAQVPAQGYHQRDYSDAQEDAFERMMALGG